MAARNPLDECEAYLRGLGCEYFQNWVVSGKVQGCCNTGKSWVVRSVLVLWFIRPVTMFVGMKSFVNLICVVVMIMI
ncbi:MAG: hypothetical protein AABZ55_00455 [Bdellovibrionota bacterium]